ncbi:lysosomal acid glucosylceramidase-like isoform X1 [Branchiostoma floridae x Branchiostoma japonicum]
MALREGKLSTYLFFVYLAFMFSHLALDVHGANECVEKPFPGQSFVCVCNSTYCDGIEPNTRVQLPQFNLYRSSKAKERFSKKILTFTKTVPQTKNIWVVNRNVSYQKIKGFGGAFTDAATINIMSLSKLTQDKLIAAYFSPKEGIEYTIGRVPMAGCDFSTREYTYADTPQDFQMDKFALTEEDLEYKIPVIKRALSMSSRNISLFGSPWSAPAWMKTDDSLTGKGTLIGQAGDKYHRAWALYFAKFLEEYKKQGLEFWGLTAQNEPADGMITKFSFNCMGWTAESQRDWIAADLGPTLEERGHGDVSLMMLDDNRIWLPAWADTVLQNATAAKYVKGVGVHWYLNSFVPPLTLSATHERHPDYFILATEACSGSFPWGRHVLLGSWDRGEDYTHDIIQNLKNWVVGWVDWNLALNGTGGPNWANNFVDAPIIVNSGKDEFYKQPMYYHLGHFSKFIPAGSFRIDVKPESSSPGNLDVVAFLTLEKSVVAVIFNRSDKDIDVSLHDPEVGYMNLTSPSHSIMTAVWWTG